MRGGSEYLNPEGVDRGVEVSGENAVAIMEQESVSMNDADDLAKLLQSPHSGGMCRNVAVDQPTGPMLDHDEYVEHAEPRRDGEAEITGQEALGLQTQEGGPVQIPSWLARRTPRHVLAHGARGDLDAELQQKLIRDALLAPASFSVAIRRITPCS